MTILSDTWHDAPGPGDLDPGPSGQSESWLAIPGYEGRYEVSDLGRVRSLLRRHPQPPPRLKSMRRDRYGYLRVSLVPKGTRDVKTHPVHRLVIGAFVGPRPAGLQVRHLDGDKANNALSNLAYGTAAENAADLLAHGNHVHGRKTHCVRGHAFDAANTAHRRGRRYCRECHRLEESARRAKRREEVRR